MARNKRPPLGARVRATGYYERSDDEGPRWVLKPAVVEGVYCGERYLQQGEQDRAELDPDAPLWRRAGFHMIERTGQIRTFLVALDHRRRVSCLPSDVEVIEGG